MSMKQYVKLVSPPPAWQLIFGISALAALGSSCDQSATDAKRNHDIAAAKSSSNEEGVVYAQRSDISVAEPSLGPPLALMAPKTEALGAGEEAYEHLNPQVKPGTLGGKSAERNFVDQARTTNAPSERMPSILINFLGLGSHFTGFHVGVAPPDTNGDVSSTHIIQIVNLGFAIFDKKGTLLYGPVDTKTLFTGFTGGEGKCETTNQGDPLVRYDRHAERWIISQFAFTSSFSGPHYQCVAVSKTSDPVNDGWYRYAFGPYRASVAGQTIDVLNDYPKTGIWPDAYYTTFNIFYSQSNGFVGAIFTAWERAAMIAGFPAQQVIFRLFGTGTGGYGGALPSDWDGPFPPPPGAPNLFVSDDNTPVGPTGKGPVLQIWKFHVDWTDPTRSTLTDIPANCPPAFGRPCPILKPIVDWKAPCNDTAADCVPQLDTTDHLFTLGDRLMYRLAYRNFPGSHESLLVQRSVDPGTNADTAIRWYELRNPTGGTLDTDQVIAQQSTYAPGDGKHRWMASMAQDHVGNMALGLSESSATTHPSIYTAGRKATDPLSTLPEPEELVLQGTGSQLATGHRWGDYSSLTLDPADDCTFWFTTEHIETNGSFNWDTQMASFKFDGCQATEDRYEVQLPARIVAGTPTSFTIRKLLNDGTLDPTYNGTGRLNSTDPRAVLPQTASFTAGIASDVPVTFNSGAYREVYVSDSAAPTISGHGSIIVTGGPAVRLRDNGSAIHPTSGKFALYNFIALDALGNLASGYTQTLTVSYSDPDATGPSTVTCEAGACEINAKLVTTGQQTVTVTDPDDPTLTATASPNVYFASLVFVDVPATSVAGEQTTFGLQARDSLGRNADTFEGDVLVTSTDPNATLPHPHLINGVASGQPVTYRKAGNNVTTAANPFDSLARGITNLPRVSPAATSTFEFRIGISSSLPLTSENGASIGNITVIARDRFGNSTPAYVGTAHFTISDPRAPQLEDRTFVNGQTGGLVVIFNSDGNQTVTATDASDPSIVGRTAGTYVFPHGFSVDNGTGLTCAAASVHATAKLSDGTTDTTYNNLVANVTLSGSSGFTPVTFVNGLATIMITGRAVGVVNVTVTDARVPTSNGTGMLTISQGPVTALATGTFPGTVTAGAQQQLTVTASDCNGVRTTYGGTVHFTSNDPQAVLPANGPLTNGTGTFPVTLKTAGAGKTITVTDIATPGLTGTVTTAVGAAATSVFTVTGPGTAAVSTAVNVDVASKDAYGNATTAFAGMVHFTSDDPAAVLPADTTLPGGQKTISIQFKTNGTRHLTATEVGTTHSGTSGDIVVQGQVDPLTPGTSSGGCSSTSGGLEVTLSWLLVALAAGVMLRRRRAYR